MQASHMNGTGAWQRNKAMRFFCALLPVSRICGSYHSMGLALTPQRVYENISYYSGLFRHLLDRLWAELLHCRYIRLHRIRCDGKGARQ